MSAQAPSSPVGRGQSFARRVFLFAGVYGLVVLLPQYFLEDRIGRDYPPPITHLVALPTFVLFASGRVAAATAVVAGIDALLGLLSLAAWRATRPAPPML